MTSKQEDWLRMLDRSTVVESTRTMAVEPTSVAALSVVAHCNLARIGARVLLPALGSGREVLLSRQEPTFAHPAGGGPPLPLADPRLSRKPLTLVPDDGGIRIERRNCPGVVTVAGRPLGDIHVVDDEQLEEGVVLLIGNRVTLLLHRAQVSRPATSQTFGLHGESDSIVALRRSVMLAADSTLPVLIQGSSGSGKELVARAIHDASARRAGPYVVINLAAIPDSLAASELFGAVRGAFTGAERARTGTFRRADGGTLFLDEVGEASADVQPLLLRALENGDVQPVGSDRAERVDVRVIAATDADLDQAVARGGFRAPLLFRLRACQVATPPLVQRRDDIARLLLRFVRDELAIRSGSELMADPGPDGEPWLSAPLMARLTAARWPGNVRQLLQVARQLVVECQDQLVARLPTSRWAQIDPPAPESGSTATGSPPADRRAKRPRKGYRRPAGIAEDELLRTLRAKRFRLEPAARALGISRTALYGLIDRCDAIRKAADLGRDEIMMALESAAGDLDVAAMALEVSHHGLKLRMRDLSLDTAR